jgi:enamine deaminase RidA (YjgF/YER057c/UK114 family)
MTAEEKLRSLNIALPTVSGPFANYANAVHTGNLLYIAGKSCSAENGVYPKGKLGREYNANDGYRFARSAGLELLAVMRHALVSLDRVARVVEVQGFVNATEDFEEHAQVLNGCSDLLVDVFGERGMHVRSVLGANSLRSGLPVIVKAVVEVFD